MRGRAGVGAVQTGPAVHPAVMFCRNISGWCPARRAEGSGRSEGGNNLLGVKLEFQKSVKCFYGMIS